MHDKAKLHDFLRVISKVIVTGPTVAGSVTIMFRITVWVLKYE